MKQTYTVTEAAKLIGCSENAVYRSIQDGIIPDLKLVGRKKLIPGKWLDDMLSGPPASSMDDFMNDLHGWEN